MESMKLSAAHLALIESMKPSAAHLALIESMKPSAAHLALMESVKPGAAQRALIATQTAANLGMRAYVPSASMIASASAQLAGLFAPLDGREMSQIEQQRRLFTQMSSLHQPWVLDQPGISMFGYARLSRISETVHSEEPYSEKFGALINEELGAGTGNALTDEEPIARDASAVAAGLNVELIAFPPIVYSDVLLSVGFEFQLTTPPVPQVIEGDDSSATFDPVHGLILLEIEQRFRQLVEIRLQSIAGSQWVKRRISEQTRLRWSTRQSEDREAERSVFGLIQYSDFMDLAEVVTQKNNWRDAFQVIFRDMNDFTASLRRLHPVRKAIAHNRPLGRADVLTLVAEATRILGVLKRYS